jgi:hypothetical protein
MLTRQVCISYIAMNETSLTNIADDARNSSVIGNDTRISTKVMIGLAD